MTSVPGSPDSPQPRPTVAIYRHDLLPASETFIRAQADHLRGFNVVYAGLRRVSGLELGERPALVVETGSLAGRIASFRMQLGSAGGSFVRRLRAHRPMLVHAHFEGGGIVALALARALRVPLVVTCHGYDVTMRDETRWPNPGLRAFYRRRRRQLQRDGACFLAVSEHIGRAMSARGYPVDRTRVLYIGVDTDRMRPDPSVVRERVVLFVGRLVEKKGCEYLVRAMRTVEQAVPDARLIVIGDGPLRGPLMAMARGTLERAEFLGQRGHDEVLAWMQRASVLCVPTVQAKDGDMDGCATVLPEAHAVGLPVASFATGGTPEAVLAGRTGHLVPEKDTVALAAAITDLLRDRNRWHEFSAAARRHACARFDIRRQTERLEQVYAGVIRPGSTIGA